MNWYDELIRKYAAQNNQNIDMSGGNRIMRYFLPYRIGFRMVY
ncbi:hypothetical protein [Niabella hibiscisoli]|nr:hypothetical protein [Niabella hibiscisoli]